MPPGVFPDPIPRGGDGCLAASAAGPAEVSLEGRETHVDLKGNCNMETMLEFRINSEVTVFSAAVTKQSYSGSRPGKALAPPPFERVPVRHGGDSVSSAPDVHHVLAMDEEEFTEALARMGMGSLNLEQVRAAFLSLDEDGGGSIEIEEFMTRLRREKKWRLRHAALKLSPKSRELLAADPLQPAGGAAGHDSRRHAWLL